jgi:NodT family efflux transporter outer membrane factor (OMF) lipoprotein
VETPQAFKENADWKVAQPSDNALPTKWWEIYNDPVLNQLEEQVLVSNQNLAQAEAQYREAKALVRGAQANFFPTVNASVSSTRAGGLASTNKSAAALSGSTAPPSTADALSISASWEPDLWGHVRRLVEANSSSAQASAAELAAMRLSLQSTLAQEYFQLRDLDADRQLYDKTVIDYKKSLQLTQNQYNAGIVPRDNVVVADTLVKTTEAQAIDFDATRASTEHAIATLVGKPASTFSIARVDHFIDTAVPAIPLGVPSALLERRPDVANAERQVAAANAQIGVAKSAYFPNLTLAASGGYDSSGLSKWISLPNRLWSVGPSLAETLFDGGARAAATDQAIATYDANVASYRQTVLTGFQQVEDGISSLRILEQESNKQLEAVTLSRQAVTLTLNQYKAGVVPFLEVIPVETTALSNERAYVDLLSKRLVTSVQLVAALGGGWDVSKLPDTKEVAKEN